MIAINEYVMLSRCSAFTAAANVTLLAFAADRHAAAAPLVLSVDRAAIDRYLLLRPAGPTAANPPHAAAAVDSCDRQTGERPPYRNTDSIAY